MKKSFTRILSLIMCIIMLVGVMPLSVFSADDEDDWCLPGYKVGDIIEFGSYPQSRVTNSSLISTLNSQPKNWISYGYYSGTGSVGSMVSGDWMKYSDVDYNDSKYRAVTFSRYRPCYTFFESSASYTYQDQNGYKLNTVYYFKYKPLKWRVLDPKDGLLICETIIDSQAFSNLEYKSGEDYFSNASCSIYANNYSASSIRKWLNDDFYKTAFTTTEKNRIVESEIDSSYWSNSNGAFSCITINDKLFLLSYEDVTNPVYGFTDDVRYDNSRTARSTDYAMCQGVYVYQGDSIWWLRSPGHYGSQYGFSVEKDGSVYPVYADVSDTRFGIRPAMRISKGVFNEKKYIADIWLNRHGDETTPDSEMVKSIVGMETASETLYNTLENDKVFKNSLMLWETLKVAFDTGKGVEELVLNRENLYEALILSLLKKVAEEEQDEIGNVIYDAIDTLGEGGKFANKYKGVADALLNIPGETLKVLEGWKTDPGSESFKEFSTKLSGLDDKTKKWSDNKYVKGIGLVAEASTSVADFYKRVLGYMIAVDMAEEMKLLLMEMQNQTRDSTFKSALQNIYTMIDNANFANTIANLKLAEDLTLDFTGVYFDILLKSVPGYGFLKSFYDAGATFFEVILNTNSVAQAYFELEVTNNFVDANRAAVTALGNRYLSTNQEEAAGAYVYAVRTYEQVYMVDIDTAESFIKKATVEGIVNRVKYDFLCLKNFITLNGEKSSYEQFIQYKDNILEFLDQLYYTVDNRWKFDPDYLEKDYPDMYPIYVNEELSQSKYTPYIISAYIDDYGKTQISWGMPNVFYDKNKRAYYPLYGIMAIDGVQAKEMIGTKVNEKEFSIANGGNEIEMYDETRFSTFDKYYSVKAYAETSVGNLYTKTSPMETVSKPTQDVKITLPLFKDEMGSTMNSLTKGIKIAIEDPSDSIYDDIMYKVYRKTADSNWKLIKTIPRGFDFNGSITTFTDETAEKDVEYQYKVSSYMEFDNGKTVSSAASAPLTVVNSSMYTFAKPVNIKNSIDNDEIMTRTVARAAEDKSGVELSWEAFDGAGQYEIYRMASYGTIYKHIATVEGEELSYFDDTVENGVTYDYVIVPSSMKNGNRVYDLNAYAQGEIEYTEGKITAVSVDDFALKYKDGYHIEPVIETIGNIEYTKTYTTSNSDVATVDENGNVTATGTGSAEITVTVTDQYGNVIEDTCTVTVSYAWWQWIIIIVLFGWIWY